VHPSDKLKGQKSNLIENKKIILGVTGSISAVETVKLARELIRHGAEVYPVMTDEAQMIIHPQALKYASGHEPILRITGKVEHVSLCEEASLFLIAPCTANTISKIAHGIGDTPVTTMALTALSKMPTMIAPAMHLAMFENPLLKGNVKKLRDLGITFVSPLEGGDLAKLATTEELVARAIREIGPRDLSGLGITIIAGSTQEPIDDVRSVTNQTSGRTGIELAKNAYLRGANVWLWYGIGSERPPAYIPIKRFETILDLFDMVKEEDRFDVAISCAAISDFIPERMAGKIPSGGELTLHMKPAKKVLDRLVEKSRFVIGFKLEADWGEAVKEGKKLIERGVKITIVNEVSDIQSDVKRVGIVEADNASEVIGTREEIAEKILDRVAQIMDFYPSS